MDHYRSLCVVIAAFNEEQALPLSHPALMRALDGLSVDGRPLEVSVLYVDDGSRDGTWDLVQAMAAADPRVGGLRLSRNFGKELALTAGLDHAEADAVVVIDADGQDPPALIATFVERWREGHDVVYGIRQSRAADGLAKRTTARGFYRIINRLSRTPIPEDAGDFRLLSRRAVLALRGLRERHRFMKGLFAWVGFRQVGVPFERPARVAGSTKFNWWKLWNFALEGITGFSTAPLRAATYVGLATALAAFGYGGWIVLKTLAWGEVVQGWPTMMTVVLFLGGVQLVALGIIGEYLGRLYEESKQRPLYLVQAARPPAAMAPARD